MTYTTPHVGEDRSPAYEDIYRIFNLIDFPAEDEDIKIYQNIQKSNIHLVVSWLTLFPYNEATQWCFEKFDANTATVMRK